MANFFKKRCTCGADIVIAKDESGKWQPLDSEISESAKVYFVLDTSDPDAVASRIDPEDAQDALNFGDLFCSHFETCTSADDFSRKNAKVR